jgi:hypothetical protein
MGRTCPLFKLHHNSLDVLTPRTFEGAPIVSRLLWLNARQIHLRRARRAFWSYVNRRVFKRVFGKHHFDSPLFAGRSSGTLSHRRLTVSLSVVSLDTICSGVELCRTAHIPRLWITSSKGRPRILMSYLTQNPKAIRLKVNKCRARQRGPL